MKESARTPPSAMDEIKKSLQDLAKGSESQYYSFRLFVSGSTPRSIRAIRNLRALCDEQLSGRYDLAVVDIYQHPELAKPDQILVTPTLVKRFPSPSRRMIGDLSDKNKVLVGLDIARSVPPDDDHGG